MQGHSAFIYKWFERQEEWGFRQALGAVTAMEVLLPDYSPSRTHQIASALKACTQNVVGLICSTFVVETKDIPSSSKRKKKVYHWTLPWIILFEFSQFTYFSIFSSSVMTFFQAAHGVGFPRCITTKILYWFLVYSHAYDAINLNLITLKKIQDSGYKAPHT